MLARLLAGEHFPADHALAQAHQVRRQIAVSEDHDERLSGHCNVVDHLWQPPNSPTCCPKFSPWDRTAMLEFPFASFIKRHTDAREILRLLATCDSDIPERRSMTTCSRLTSSRARPI